MYMYMDVLKVYMVHCHDLQTWWRHQMETFPHCWHFVRGIHRSAVNFPHKGQWRGGLMFSLICAWTNGWVNHRESGDLSRHRAYYDVTVMDAAEEVHWNQLKMSVAKICLNTLRPRQNGRHFPDDIFKCIFVNKFRVRFHWNLFPMVQLTIFQYCFR